MRRSPPVLWISFPPCTTSADRVQAVARAVELGWAPTYLPDELTTPPREVVEALVDVCDAFWVVGPGKRDDRRDLKAWNRNVRRNDAWTYDDRGPTLGRLGDLRQPPELPPEAAAKRLTAEGWACMTCSRWWGALEDAARWCCASKRPCGRCGELQADKGWTCCHPCRQALDDDRWAKRERKEWTGDGPAVDATGRWYNEPEYAMEAAFDAFEDREGREPTHAEALEELRGMHLMLGEPSTLHRVEALDLVRDEIADGDDDPDVSILEGPVEALNQAIEALEARPFSWDESNVAVDVDATWGAEVGTD